MTERSVLFACDLDSQIFGALPLARRFRARGWRTSFAVDFAPEVPAAALARLKDEFVVHEQGVGALAADDRLAGFDAVGVYATGSRIARFRQDLELAMRARGGPRPALFCGFNGLVFEKFEEGAAWRLGYDLLCLNGPRDRDAFAAFVAATPHAAQPVVLTGLRRRADAPPPARHADGARKRFVFAEQVAVPTLPEDRAALAADLVRLAAASPDWDVVVKLRIRPGERTFYDIAAPFEAMLARAGPAPRNLVVSHQPLDGLLAGATLFATVSSTALFDAFDHGTPSIVVGDFGVRNAYGTHVLFGSGLMLRLADLATLDDAPRRAPDPVWLDQVGYGGAHGADALVDRLEAFDPAGALPPAPPLVDRPPPAPLPPVQVAVRTAREALKASLEAADRSGARAALGTFAAALAAADAQRHADIARVRGEGRFARMTRRFGVYWLYRRVRRRLFGEG